VVRQPFVFDRPVAPDDLVDREHERATLVERLEGGTNTRLTSPRDYGKTSLVRAVLVEVQRAGMVAVYVDLDGVRTRAQLAARIEEGYQRLTGPVRRTYAALRRRGGQVGAGGVAVGVGADHREPEFELERRLRDLLDLPLAVHRKQGARVAVVFDEFQSILDAGEGLDGAIRSVIQHHGDAACYVFCGSHPGMMAALFADQRRPFYGQAAPLVLEPLPDEALADYIAGRFERTGRQIGEVLDWLLGLAEGHPQRAMLLAHVLWSETAAGANADDDAWERALNAVWPYLREPFRSQWESMTGVERGVVEAVASARAGLTARDTRERFGLPVGSAAPDAARRLTRGGVLLEDQGATGYRIVDPLFGRWIAAGRQWPYLRE
jgi:hypothetical protein